MEAFAAAQATKTPAVIKLINDVSIGNRNVVLANDGDITFDLNGCVFSGCVQGCGLSAEKSF